MDTENLAVEPAIADESAEAPKVEAPAESAPAAPEPEAKPERDKIQERFDKLTREKYEALRAKDALEWELQRIREAQAKPDPVAPETTKAPTLADFEYDEAKYQAAMTQYAAAEARKAALEAIKAEREKETTRAKVESFRSREAKFAEKTADYREAVYSDQLPISEAMAEVIRESDEGPALAYYLAKNRDIAEAIYALPPIAAARELGKIEARLTAPPPPAPKVSEAPPPPPKLAATEPAIEKDPSQMSDAEFAKWRRKSMAAYKSRSR